jgi:hypothetical protein
LDNAGENQQTPLDSLRPPAPKALKWLTLPASKVKIAVALALRQNRPEQFEDRIGVEESLLWIELTNDLWPGLP